MNRKIQNERHEDEPVADDDTQPSILPPDGIIDSAADIDPGMSRGTASKDSSQGGVKPDPDRR